MTTDPVRPIPSERTTFEWNTIIRRSPPRQALSIYAYSMLPSGAAPNKFTFTFLLTASLRAALPRLAPHLHSHLIKLGFHSDPFLRSSLISSYAALGHISTVHHLFRHGGPHSDVVLHTALVSAYARLNMPDSARQAFDQIPHPNPVSWAALTSAYTRAGRHADALSAFRGMRLAGAAPTEAALVSALGASAALGAISEGERAHRHVVTRGVLTAALGTALLTMYAKCGRVEYAVKVFDEMTDRDQPTWTAMISALAAHGKGREAVQLFEEMVGSGVPPDHVAYVGVLHACSHAGMVKEARELFDRMERVHGITARGEHYGCMVDVLGRGGHVEEAWEMVRSMPVEPDEHVLKSLLSTCCSEGFVEYAEWAAERLAEMKVGSAAAYVLLANLYAGMGRWEESARVRRRMRERGVPKSPGCSAVD